MKKTLTFLLAMFATGAVFAQSYQRADQDLLMQKHSAKTLPKDNGQNLLQSKPVNNSGAVVTPSGKTAAVSPVQLGKASNAYTIITSEQNQVYASDSLNTVAFIHRHDVNTYGGGSAENGKFRYDLSTDGGATFTNDIGVLNPTYSRYSRYPNMSMYSPAGNTNPMSANLVYMGATLGPGGAEWDGFVSGVTDVGVNPPTIFEEEYSYQFTQSLIPVSLTEGQHGVFWAADRSYDDASATALDTIWIYKGMYDETADTLGWTKDKLVPAWEKTIPDGNGGTGIRAIGPIIEFAPDGQTGWIGMMGDLIGGHDSVYSPIFVKTTDGGQTWGTPVEVDLRTIGWIKDSLQQLWIAGYDTGNNPVPASTGNPTTAFDFDMTVDANGNPHLFTIIGSGSTQDSAYQQAGAPAYSIYSGLAKFACDITTTDGGATWTAHYVAPVLAFRYEIQSSSDPLAMDNTPGVSRSADGSHVFYSWTDSDTMTTGFGASDNNVPNLMISGLRVNDGFRTCYKSVTKGDLLWEGRALFPTIAPDALTGSGGGSYELPIVMVSLDQNDPLLQVSFWYFGNDAVLNASEFMDPNTLNLAWDAVMNDNCSSVMTSTEAEPVDFNNVTSYPNPANENFTLRFDLGQSSNVQINMFNTVGQKVKSVANGEFAAGMHDVNVNVSDLPNGVYYIHMTAGEQTFTNKVVVSK